MDKKHPTIEATRKRNDFGAVLVETVNERIKASRELIMQSRELLDTLSMRKQETKTKRRQKTLLHRYPVNSGRQQSSIHLPELTFQ